MPHKPKLIKKSCEVCFKEFDALLWLTKRGRERYCSRKCYWIWMKGKSGNKKGKIGAIPWNKGLKGVQTAWNKNKPYLQIRGENHPRWNGGKSKNRHKGREYILWRTAVFMRDNYQCVSCGSKGYLQADHIKPWALYPELRYAIDNGRTLCLPCHQKTESFPKQFIRGEVD